MNNDEEGMTWRMNIRVVNPQVAGTGSGDDAMMVIKCLVN